MLNDSNAQTKNYYYMYPRPQWTVGIGAVWNLATNDAYGRANYSDVNEVLRDNYGMRWGVGGYLFAKYGLGKMKNDRLYLGYDYKSMNNADFEGADGNNLHYDISTIGLGYEYVFYGKYRFRSFYGIGLTGNIISGKFTPRLPNGELKELSFESSFRMGMEIKTGLEFIFNNKHRDIGVNLGATYNLTNLFNDDNRVAEPGQYQNLSLNDGKDNPRAGFKRYIGIVSINLGLNWYPDVKRKKIYK